MSVDLDVSVPVTQIAHSLSDRDAAELLDHLADSAARIVRRMKPQERGPWRRAFIEQPSGRTPSEKTILGREWQAVEEMLDRGDLYELRRWLAPYVREAMPRPSFKGEP